MILNKLNWRIESTNGDDTTNYEIELLCRWLLSIWLDVVVSSNGNLFRGSFLVLLLYTIFSKEEAMREKLSA